MPPDAPLPTSAFISMGTVVSVRVGGDLDRSAQSAALDAASQAFRRWDDRCSLYRPDSELSRVSSGELALTAASEDLRDAYAVALEWRARTGGAFTPHRGNGSIDLNGVVKALALADAGRALDELGFEDWALGAGGDVLVRGDRGDRGARYGREWEKPTPWTVGIADPHDRRRLLGAIELDGVRRAVATSGGAERGDHIWTPAGAGPTPFAQVSVAASDILTADVLATAIVAGGRASLDDLAAREPIDVLAVLHDGSLLATPGWPGPRARASAC